MITVSYNRLDGKIFAWHYGDMWAARRLLWSLANLMQRDERAELTTGPSWSPKRVMVAHGGYSPVCTCNGCIGCQPPPADLPVLRSCRSTAAEGSPLCWDCTPNA